MKRFLTAAVAVTALAAPSIAAAQGPGQFIQSACPAGSFGQIVSSVEPGFPLGQHAHGGAAAFAALSPEYLAAHGCTG